MAAMEVLPSSPISPCVCLCQGKPTRRKKRTSKFASRIDSALSESEDSSAAKPRSDSGGRSSDASKPSRRRSSGGGAAQGTGSTKDPEEEAADQARYDKKIDRAKQRAADRLAALKEQWCVVDGPGAGCRGWCGAGALTAALCCGRRQGCGGARGARQAQARHEEAARRVE